MSTGYDFGEVSYDLAATGTGPEFSVHLGPRDDGFRFAYTGTWAGTAILQQDIGGTWLDVDGTSKTANQGLTLVPFNGAGTFRFKFTRTSGAVTCTASADNGLLDWASALRLEGITGVLLLETNSPLILE